MFKKRGRNIIIRRGTIKVSFFDTSLFDEKYMMKTLRES